MVKITNGVNTFEVTFGAFVDIFNKKGYRIILLEGKDHEGDAEASDEGIETNENEQVDPDVAFCNDIEEKPVSQWNKNEIKRYAALKGIDISGTKNAGEAKEIIVEFLESRYEL